MWVTKKECKVEIRKAQTWKGGGITLILCMEADSRNGQQPSRPLVFPTTLQPLLSGTVDKCPAAVDPGVDCVSSLGICVSRRVCPGYHVTTYCVYPTILGPETQEKDSSPTLTDWAPHLAMLMLCSSKRPMYI